MVIHPTSTVHALVRFRDGAALAHLGYPDMRVPISYALTYPERAADARSAARPDRHAARVRGARPRDVPAARARARARASAAAPHPCAYNAANEVAVEAFLDGRLPFLGIAAVVEETLARLGRRSRPATSTTSSRPTPAHGRSPSEELVVGVNVIIAILGLALLVLVHEAGHFFAALAVGMSPRKFYIGFPPAIVKTDAQRRSSTGSARSRSAAT